MRTAPILACLFGLALIALPAVATRAEQHPIRIAINAEFGVVGSTSAQAIRMGAGIAADEINAAGGLLGGRKLEIIERDDRSVPARAIKNLQSLAADPFVIAVLCGKYSPVAVESLPEVQRLGLPLLDPWSAADSITEGHEKPNYVFRLSLRDSWAMQTMSSHAQDRGFNTIGLLLPNTEWGRSSERAIRRSATEHNLKIVATEWYNWGDPSLLEHYQTIIGAKADALILVANEREGTLLVRELAGLPKAQRLPILSHWGITGGNFFQGAGDALREVDLSVVQTYSFIGAADPVARRVIDAAKRLGVHDERAIASPVGVAQAYDLVHILARAIHMAGSADRAQVRDALERVTNYAGLIGHYARPFEPSRHDALTPSAVFMARYSDDGAIERIPSARK